jgi:hypothetical protein
MERVDGVRALAGFSQVAVTPSLRSISWKRGDGTRKLAVKSWVFSGSGKTLQSGFIATTQGLNGLDYLVTGVGECRLFRLAR